MHIRKQEPWKLASFRTFSERGADGNADAAVKDDSNATADDDDGDDEVDDRGAAKEDDDDDDRGGGDDDGDDAECCRITRARCCCCLTVSSASIALAIASRGGAWPSVLALTVKKRPLNASAAVAAAVGDGANVAEADDE